MNDHYYTENPNSAHDEREVTIRILGLELRFTTDAGTFSRDGLDRGTEVLLEALPPMTGHVLDLGCGWGAIGVSVARANPGCRVVMADVNRRALQLSRDNLERNHTTAEVIESDGMAQVLDRTFDAVITNPPIRAGKQVIYKMFADAAAHLNQGGALYLVIRKQQGAESCVKYLKTLFGQVEKLDKSGGFWVLKASEPLERN